MFCISTILYLDNSDYGVSSRGVYKNIVTVSPELPPSHILYSKTTKIHTNKLSTFNEHSTTQCLTAFRSGLNPNKLMTEDEIPELIATPGLTINTAITEMLNNNSRLKITNNRNIICYIN